MPALLPQKPRRAQVCRSPRGHVKGGRASGVAQAGRLQASVGRACLILGRMLGPCMDEAAGGGNVPVGDARGGAGKEAERLPAAAASTGGGPGVKLEGAADAAPSGSAGADGASGAGSAGERDRQPQGSFISKREREENVRAMRERLRREASSRYNMRMWELDDLLSRYGPCQPRMIMADEVIVEDEVIEYPPLGERSPDPGH